MPQALLENPTAVGSIAKDAYIYGVPMVALYQAIYAYSINKNSPQYRGPFNTILNIARVFTPDDTAFVTPNSDTPYSFACLDLRAEPMVITIPKMERNRYFVFQLMDLYTFNFAYIGSRTTGNDGGTYLIAGPAWDGEVPRNISKAFHTETQIVSVVGRTQLFNPEDLPNVKNIQAGYKVRPLHEFLGASAPPPSPSVNWPRPIAPAEQTSPAFFDQMAFLLQFCLPPHPSEIELRNQFEEIGIRPGQPFDASSSPDVHAALKAGMQVGQKAIDVSRGATHGKTDTLFGNREYLQNNYLARATGT